MNKLLGKSFGLQDWTNKKLTFVTKEQFRFPRSKKSRIRKKWAKNPKNWRPILPKRVTHYVRSQVVEGTGMTLDCDRNRSCVLCENRVPRTFTTTVRDYNTGEAILLRLPEWALHQIYKAHGLTPDTQGVDFLVTRKDNGIGYDIEVRRAR